MKVSTLSSALALSYYVVTARQFGNYFSSGPTVVGNFIRESITTIVVKEPRVLPPDSILSIWPGMGSSSGDLVQALLLSFPQQGGLDLGGCKPTGVGWCVQASVLSNDEQIRGSSTQILPGTPVTIHYIYDDAKDLYNQFVYVSGHLVSTLSRGKGATQGWGTAEECQTTVSCGDMSAHSFLDTTITLNKPQSNYSSTFAVQGASHSIASSDGGKTWKGDIHIDAFHFTDSK